MLGGGELGPAGFDRRPQRLARGVERSTGLATLVGFEWNPARPWHPGRAAVLYTAAGGAGLLLVIVLALFGLAFGYFL